MTNYRGAILLLLVFVYISGTDALTCFVCTNIAYPRDCPFVAECGANEECYVDQIVTQDGNIYYTSGCRDTLRCTSKRNTRQLPGGETITCSHCCNKDHCNYGGCGEPDLPDRSQRGPICYNCFEQRTESGCNKVKVCERGQTCEIIGSPHALYNVAYRSGCLKKETCDVFLPPAIGKRQLSNHKRSGKLCFSCCNDDLCNKNCTTPTLARTSTAATTQPPSTTTTTMKTTTTTLRTTTPTTTTTTASHKCSAAEVRYKNSCYLFSTEIKYWGEALQICRIKGGSLLKIDDPQEQQFVENQIRPLVTGNKIPSDVWGYYMGAHLDQGQWKWADGTPLTWKNWGLNEPDNPQEQIYGLIFLPGHYTGDYKWGSHKDMLGTSRYICESPLP